MIEKDAFDRQINSIRNRYQKLCQPNPVDTSKISSFNIGDSFSGNNPIDAYVTPIRAHKIDQYEDSISFSKLPGTK